MESRVREVTCRLCNGTKESLNCGMMKGKCVECDGEGIIYDVLTDEEVRIAEETKKVTEAQLKSQKREKLLANITKKMMYNNSALSYEEAKELAKSGLENVEKKEQVEEVKTDSLNEKSRKPRLKKEIKEIVENETLDQLAENLG